MTKDDFILQRTAGNKYILEKIISVFSQLGVVAVHQFGSFAKETADEFSDHDLWITCDDSSLREIIDSRDDLFSKVGTVVLTNEPPQNVPPGGMYTMVIYETEYGFYHVDYFLVAKSRTKILPESRLLYGEDSLPREDWFQEQFNLAIKPSVDPNFRKQLLICFAFIGVKYVVRKRKPFLDLLAKEYTENRNKYFRELEPLKSSYDFVMIAFILEQHKKVADDHENQAIDKILHYLHTVEELYA